MRQEEMFPRAAPKWYTDLREARDGLDPELARVKLGLAAHIFEFCESRAGTEFHMSELNDWVSSRRGVAPSSPDRILRQLRLDGIIRYTVVNRGKSLYRIDSVRSD